ncbi:MAG: dihydropyrimidinase, partial [Planctomycetota bacterium]
MMRFDTIIANGTIVNADKSRKADVALRGEKIAAVGRRLAAKAAQNGTRIIDADGCYVLPGAVDVHVHLALPFCGTTSSDDYDSGTRAAARGGVTTVIDFAIPYGKDTLHHAVDNWMAKADGIACVDYAFHLAITNWDQQKKELPSLVKAGIPTFKQFMIYEAEGWQSDDADMFQALEALKDLGGMLMVHAESSRVLGELIARHHNPREIKQHGAYLHTITRPNFIEAEAIRRAVTWAEATGGKLYVVHISSGEGADIIRDARQRGHKNVYGETCAQYLALDDSRFKGKDGHLYATCPQLKKPEDQRRLWKAVKDGTLCAVSTDTCTFTRKQKAIWKGDWTKIPMGMPGLETLVPVVYTEGVLKKRLTIRQLVDKCCTSPAKIMGLGNRKGVIKKGHDADIAIIHPTRKTKVDWRKMETNADWSPYQGWSLAGFARTTLS